MIITLSSLVFFGILILAIPTITLASIYSISQDREKTLEQEQPSLIDKRNESASIDKQTNKVQAKNNNDVVSIIVHSLPIIAIEIILLYYFRILLQSYNSSKSQIMQLQMRNALCQFIEPYVQFKEEHKEFKDSFEKFESQIFSSLAPNDESIPSTFDGLEQLGKLVKTLRG